MPGTVLENLSGRKLSILVTILLSIQLICFLIGFAAPKPASSQQITMKVCLDRKTDNATEYKWITRENCKQIDLEYDSIRDKYTANDLVFIAQMPNFNYDYSRWQQNLIGMLLFDFVHEHEFKLTNPIVQLTLDSRLAYSDKLDHQQRTRWKTYAKAIEKRYMDCYLETDDNQNLDGYPYVCSMVQLFELGSLYHDYYLLNLRLPYDEKLKTNIDLPRLIAAHLHAINMNGGYTQVFTYLKSVFFPLICLVIYWFWNRVYHLTRTPALLEYMLLTLGVALALLDAPFEYFTLHFDLPFMLLFGDVRQGIFYASLLSFWLVFAGEHMLIQDNGEINSIRMYWKHLSTVLIGCLSLLIFDLCERGIQLINPFYSIWITPVGTNLALSFIILAGISSGLYFIFLCYMVWIVFKNISVKRAILPSMSQARRLHYEGIIYRFNFLMLATLICAAITVVGFIVGQIAEGRTKWDDSIDVDVSSPLHTGIYGMWNVYTMAMLLLYAPSHKRWNDEQSGVGVGVGNDDVEFDRLPNDAVSVNEISALTSFATKASIE